MPGASYSQSLPFSADEGSVVQLPSFDFLVHFLKSSYKHKAKAIDFYFPTFRWRLFFYVVNVISTFGVWDSLYVSLLFFLAL